MTLYDAEMVDCMAKQVQVITNGVPFGNTADVAGALAILNGTLFRCMVSASRDPHRVTTCQVSMGFLLAISSLLRSSSSFIRPCQILGSIFC